MKKSDRFKKHVPSLLLLLLFEAVAVTLWLAKDNLFYSVPYPAQLFTTLSHRKVFSSCAHVAGKQDLYYT